MFSIIYQSKPHERVDSFVNVIQNYAIAIIVVVVVLLVIGRLFWNYYKNNH